MHIKSIWVNCNILPDNLYNVISVQGFVFLHVEAFNNFNLDESTRLSYNENSDLYEGARLFKQGFYNYKYVLKRTDGTIDEGFFSGNFDETENSYQVLIYYRNPGARYDQLIGIGTGNSTNISN